MAPLIEQPASFLQQLHANYQALLLAGPHAFVSETIAHFSQRLIRLRRSLSPIAFLKHFDKLPGFGATSHSAKKRNLPDPAMMREMVQALSRRKKLLFPDDSRIIVDCKVTTTPDGYHVTVVSARTA